MCKSILEKLVDPNDIKKVTEELILLNGKFDGSRPD